MSDQRGDGAVLIGVDVGGTKILAMAIAAADVAGTTHEGDVPPEPVGVFEVPTPTDPDLFDDAVTTAVTNAAAGAPIAAVGIGVPGFIGLDGIARQAPNAPAAIGVDLEAIVRAHFGVPCAVDNDANCAARAASRWDAPEAKVVVAVTLGTGIGGGVVVDDEVMRGAHGFASEPGHMIVDVNGPPCPCGQRGCWEVLASGSGLGRLGRAAVAEGTAPTVLAAAGGIDAVDGPLVARLSSEGDAAASAIFDVFAGWVAIGIVNLINLVDPDVIVLGGGVVREGRALTDRIEAALRSYPTITQGRHTPVVASGMGHTAGALGAVLLARAVAGAGVD